MNLRNPNLQTKKGMNKSKHSLTPVTLSGIVAPYGKSISSSRNSDYKLIGSSKLEYFLVADDEWREVLSKCCWEEVEVIGLLNVGNMTLIPQKVYPKGTAGENVIDMATWKRKEAVKKMVKTLNDLVVIPVAVLAVLAL